MKVDEELAAVIEAALVERWEKFFPSDGILSVRERSNQELAQIITERLIERFGQPKYEEHAGPETPGNRMWGYVVKTRLVFPWKEAE